VLEASQTIFKDFQVLIFTDQIQDLQSSPQYLDLLANIGFNLVLQVDQIPILFCQSLALQAAVG
jgi:hypothetical protein